MKRIAAILAVILSLSLLSVPFGAAGLVTVTSPARLMEEIASSDDMEVINLSRDMAFGEGCESIYLNKSVVLRGDKATPVTLTDGRFIVEGQKDLPITVVFENISFISSSDSGAPAVDVKGNVNITFSGCTFVNYRGSGVRIAADEGYFITSSFMNCAFKGNSTFSDLDCSDFGGGICAMGVDNNLTLNLTDCIFEDNCSVYGGGLFFKEAAATVTGCTFKNNGAKDSGGGIYGQRGSLTLNGCTFNLNSAKGYGGGIALLKVKLTMVDCVVAQNGAKTAGGGLWLKELGHPRYSGDNEDIANSYPYNIDVNIDNCSFYLNEVNAVYSRSDPDTDSISFDLMGYIKVNIRLSTFAYHQGEQTVYDNPYVNFFGCIIEEDGALKQMPSKENGYCLIYSGDDSQPTVDSEHRLADCPHLNCLNDSPELRIPLEAVKEAYGNAFSGYYGTFPVGDNSGEVEMNFTFHSLRTQIVKATRGTPIPEIPAPMRDMYTFGGWYLPDGSRLAGYRLLVGGDVSSIDFSPLWTHNTRYYLTLAGCVFVIACGTVGWILIKRRMKKILPYA